MANETDPKHGNMVGIPFAVANAVTNASNVDLTLPAGGTLFVAPKAGSVVGVSVGASADLSAGTATFKPHKASTEYADTGVPAPVLNDTNQKSYAMIRPRVLRFAAGDGLGVSYSSSTDMAPTNTNDFDATLFVIFDND